MTLIHRSFPIILLEKAINCAGNIRHQPCIRFICLAGIHDKDGYCIVLSVGEHDEAHIIVAYLHPVLIAVRRAGLVRQEDVLLGQSGEEFVLPRLAFRHRTLEEELIAFGKKIVLQEGFDGECCRRGRRPG